MKKGVQGFAFLLLSLVLVSFLSISLVSTLTKSENTASSDLTETARTTVATGAKQTTTVFERMFGVFKGTGGISPETQLTITKWILIFLVVLVVYSIATFIPFFPENQPSIRWFFAIAIGILSFIFVKPEEIGILLKSYQALGIAVTSVIPLIIILTLTHRLREASPGTAIIVNKVILILFLGYLIFQWATLEVPVNQDPPALAWLYPICAVITLVWLLGEGYFSKMMEDGKEEVKEDRVRRRLKRSTAYVNNTANAETDLEKQGGIS